jgi:hypothetical protein
MSLGVGLGVAVGVAAGQGEGAGVGARLGAGCGAPWPDPAGGGPSRRVTPGWISEAAQSTSWAMPPESAGVAAGLGWGDGESFAGGVPEASSTDTTLALCRGRLPAAS